MRRGRRQPPPDLTSLFDVLFIVIFAALIRAAAVQHAAEAAPKPPPPPKPLDPASLQARAGIQVSERPNVIVRVAADGHVTEPAIATFLTATTDRENPVYTGDVCGFVHEHQPLVDLPRALVIIAPAVKLADLPHALYEGLRGDVDRCLQDHHALAVIIEP
ncbi:MAG: hypothetical protein JO257_16355 [Deltaproteobacteria bacterium]|nr:hypothetical protein [Deltaproteobacteria bacterium]